MACPGLWSAVASGFGACDAGVVAGIAGFAAGAVDVEAGAVDVQVGIVAVVEGGLCAVSSVVNMVTGVVDVVNSAVDFVVVILSHGSGRSGCPCQLQARCASVALGMRKPLDNGLKVDAPGAELVGENMAWLTPPGG
ncbi:hypothetical protein GQ602_006743 [Ophiocordyceps camponoti-floridani]|uniref:Uncharacterized protein n=1 Tax=Ophiocordyceps camponoti-floridani TaxID=2030778 RepID=A0A8H4VB42_9HYPO|nr:hypothetical protein GQ602_006743 [Ophiocordyceps camponoti-floridani]